VYKVIRVTHDLNSWFLLKVFTAINGKMITNDEFGSASLRLWRNVRYRYSPRIFLGELRKYTRKLRTVSPRAQIRTGHLPHMMQECWSLHHN